MICRPGLLFSEQTQRWIRAGVFEAMVHDLRALLRVASGRNPEPSAAIFDSRNRSNLRPNRESVPDTTEPSGGEATKRILRLTLWAICWRCW